MSSSDSSDSDSSSDEEEQQKIIQTPATAKDDSDSSDSDSSDDEEETKVAAKTSKPAAKAESDSDSDSDSDSEDEKPAAKTAPAATKTAQAEDSDSDSDSDDEEEEKTAAKPVETKAEESDSDSDSDSEEEEKKPAAKPAETKAEDSDSDSDSEMEEEKKPAEAADSDSDSDEEMKETEDFSASLASNASVTPVFSLKLKLAEKSAKVSKKKGKKRKLEDDKPRKVKKVKKSKDVKEEKKEEAKEEKKEEAKEEKKEEGKKTIELTKEFFPNSGEFRNENLKGSSSTVMVRGISIGAFESDIREFFKTSIEDPIRINHKWSEERPGIAFVSFSSPEVATAACINSHKEYIKDRYVFCDWAEDFKQSARKNNRGPRNAHLKDTTSRIWIGNLHREVYEDAIQGLFKDVGTLTDVFIIGKDESRPKVAYVSFSTNEEASACVEKFQNHELMDQNIRLDWAEPRKDNGASHHKKRELSEKQDGCVTVFLGGLTEEVNDEKLAEFFKEAGTIELIRYPEPWKGIAFCKFTETEATDKAVLRNGDTFMGRNLRVDFAADKKRAERESSSW